MKNFLRVICSLIIVFLFQASAYSFDIKKYNPFKKKVQPEKPKMIETRQEWEVEAINIPLSEREVEFPKNNVDEKKYYIPEPEYIFELYNYPQGKRELDVSDVKRKLKSGSYLVVDNSCQYAAYSRYYFSPDINQISSEFFVEKLDTKKTRKKRIIDYRHSMEERIPIIQAGVYEKYPNLFNGLNIVDWSHDGKKILIKEKIGSAINGIYKTMLYIHFLPTAIQNSKTIRLTDLDSAIKYYFLNWEKKQLNKYRYDVEPIGFSAENDDIIICILYVYDKNNRKIFLSTWGYNCVSHEVLLISKKDNMPKVSINGLILKRVLK